MALTPGTRFGAYEITGSIGAGGMGEVYRATDTNLKRDVAIKVLPTSFVGDSDRISRFQREAEVLASLNHPNIAQIYGLERIAGDHDGGGHADEDGAGEIRSLSLIMELVEGVTLEEKLKNGALSVENALRLALQIAEALEAAHAKGVIHRDLKPANVMVTAGGQVKVLDFGLAKAFSTEPEGAAPADSPALSLAMTQAGLILGTAGYMSPEQASGQATDQRADVWAFGVVLYEMLTGLPLFKGESVPHILAAVLQLEPDWDRLPVDLHPRLRLLLERCLEKKPRDRYHSISDARVDIEKVLSDPDGAAASLITQTGAATSAGQPGAGQPMSRRLLFAAALVATGGTVAGLGAWNLKPAPAPEPRQVFRVTETHAAGTFSVVGVDPTIAISPDGRRILFRRPSVGGSGVFVRTLDATEPRLVPGTQEILMQSPTFSPDGSTIAFVANNNELRRIPVSGGPSVTLATDVVSPFGLDWMEDGTILYSTAREIRRVSENGGEPKVLITVESGQQAQRPQQLPGGDWILYVAMRGFGGSLEASELVVESPSTGERRVIRGAVTDARYIATGHIVYAFDGVLYAVPFDVDSLEVAGGPIPVTQGVSGGVIGLHQFDVSDTGHLVYLPGLSGTTTTELRLAIADPTGNVAMINVPTAAYGHVRPSPDGRWLAIDTTNPNEEAIVWIYELAGTSAMRRLTFEGNNRFPVWSPDSERIAFQSDRNGNAAIYVQRIDGAGGAQRLTTPDEGETHVPESWSPDGRFLSFAAQRAQTNTLSILSLEDGSVARFGSFESMEPIGSVFSPDGNWLAYHALPPGATATNISSGIYVEPFPATGARYQAPKVVRDFQPFWSPDGTALRYIGSTAANQLVSVDVSTNSGFSFGSPSLIPFTLTAGRLSASTRGFDVLPDGRFVGPIRGGAASDNADSPELSIGSQMRIVLNWTEELKRLVPVK